MGYNCQITGDQTASLFCSMDKIESIGKLMVYVGPDKLYTTIKAKDIYQNLGEIIEEEAGKVKKLIQQIEGGGRINLAVKKNRLPHWFSRHRKAMRQP